MYDRLLVPATLADGSTVEAWVYVMNNIPQQAKVIARAGPHGSTIDLDGNVIEVYAQDETSYGEPAGLFGRQFMPN